VTKWAYRLVLILIIAAGVLSVVLTFKDIRFLPHADEGCYFRYASFISVNGLSGFSELFKNYLFDPHLWLFPSPLRVGYICLSAIWLRLTGPSFINLAYLSLVFYAFLLLISYYFSRKYLGPRLALFFTALLAFSPLQMALSRRVLLESAPILFCTLSIWLFWEFLQKKNHLKLSLFIMVYSFSILVRESALFLTVPFLIMLLMDRFVYRRECVLKYFILVLLLPSLIVFMIYVFLGCLPYVFSVANIVLGPPQANPYAVLFGSGPWYRYLIDYLLLSPWIVILSIGFIFYFFLNRLKDNLVVYFFVIFISNLILLNCFNKNLRYAMNLDLPLRLFSLLMVDTLAHKFFSRQAAKVVFILVVLLLASDYLNFYHLFVQEAIYDPTSFSLLRARQMIPF